MSNFFEQRLSESSQASRFSVGGKIRVGTKAISKKTMEVANSNPKVGAIIARVREGKMSFREAEKELYKTANMSNPFYPRNTREFHAHAWDMGIGGISTSRKILEMYGEKLEGDDEAKLYKFPVVFPEVGRNATAIIDGGMAVQGGGPNTVRYWSGYDATGVRVCMHLPEVEKSEQAQRRGRSVRHPERKPVTRGACEPGACFEFQNGMCRFNGTVRFYVPGIAGAGVFELHTGSTQAATEIYLRLTEALRATGGRLQNYTPDGKPVFWLTKKLTTRKYFENGEPKVGEQWVPMLEMEIEMPKVLWLAQQAAAMGSLPNSMNVPSAWVDGGSQERLDQPIPAHHQMETFDEDGVIDETSGQEPSRTSKEREHFDADDRGKNDEGRSDVQQPKADVPKTPQEANKPTAELVQSMKGHAKANGYEEVLARWIQSKHDGDFDRAASTWNAMFQRMGARAKDYIDLAMFLYDQKMNPEMALHYLKIKFGPTGNGQKISQMKAHLEDLVSDGVSVATAVMEETIDAQ